MRSSEESKDLFVLSGWKASVDCCLIEFDILNVCR